MKTIKGISALMLAAAFMISTAAIAVPGASVVKHQAKTEKKAPAPKKAKKEKKVVKKTSTKKSVKKAAKTPAPAAK